MRRNCPQIERGKFSEIIVENFKSFLTRSQNFQKIKNCVFLTTLSFNRKIGILLTNRVTTIEAALEFFLYIQDKFWKYYLNWTYYNLVHPSFLGGFRGCNQIFHLNSFQILLRSPTDFNHDWTIEVPQECFDGCDEGKVSRGWNKTLEQKDKRHSG